jgi:tRNA(Ile)-lysidine synthase
MADYARAHGIATLLIAHTLDDQAETLLIRLARGSGLDGLAAIQPVTHVGQLRLVRPLLGVAKSRLVATLRQRSVPWIEDPSNQSPAFERTRLRAARDTLDALGLTPSMLGLSARRLQRARTALDSATESLCAAPPEGIVKTDPCGTFAVDRVRLSRAPEEIVLRLLERCIAAAGGSQEPVPLGKLESIVADLMGRDRRACGSWTLSRALIAATPETLAIEREPGRQELPRLVLAAGAGVLWDGRFAASVGEGVEGSPQVRALGADGVAELRRLAWSVRPTRALQLCPSFWDGSRLLAAPTVGFWAADDLRGRLCAAFVGVRYNPEASLRAPRPESDQDS